MSRFEVETTDIPDLVLVRPRPTVDARGWFMRTFSADEFAAAGVLHTDLVQENHSRSSRGVIRGLHTRAELREYKLVRVPHGRIFDVVADLRPWSPTFMQWRGFIVDDVDHLQVRVPAGCAHGFQTLSESADVCYRVDAPYDPRLDITISWRDPQLNVDWPMPDAAVLSERDRTAPPLSAVFDRLSDWFGAQYA
jgi:dTDP-4-dehydrorhamnose 3,5-epimerase